jgi:tetratricopeptide (TPR) repeat protein
MRFKETVAFILISTFCIPAVFAFQDDDTALRWYQKRAEEVSDQLSFDAALKEAERHLHKAIQSDNLTHQLRAIKEKGLIYLIHAHDYDKALGHFIEALRLEDSLNIAREQMFTYLAIAKVFEEVGDNLQARHFLEQAREINQRFNDMATAAFILNKLGKIHAALGELGEALGIYNTILQYAGNLDDRSIEAEAFFNKAHLYTLQGKYEDALNIHKNALKIRRQLKDRKNEARLLSDIGELYGLMRNGERAFANFEAARIV